MIQASGDCTSIGLSCKHQITKQASDHYCGSIRLSYKHQTILQASDWSLYKHEIIIETSNCYTSMGLFSKHQHVYKHQTGIQASDWYTSLRFLYRHQMRLYKHQIVIQASDYSTSIRWLCKHQIIVQTSDDYTSIRLLCKDQIIALLYKHQVTIHYYTSIIWSYKHNIIIQCHLVSIFAKIANMIWMIDKKYHFITTNIPRRTLSKASGSNVAVQCVWQCAFITVLSKRKTRFSHSVGQ